VNLQALIAGGELDRATIERLKQASPDELRKLLSPYLPDDQVEAILKRIAALVAAL
jgi:hypothetical protein